MRKLGILSTGLLFSGAILYKTSPSRGEILKNLKTDEFDCLVIGGGATGTGIALDAASRGLRVGLIEREDYSSGTSSKSSIFHFFLMI